MPQYTHNCTPMCCSACCCALWLLLYVILTPVNEYATLSFVYMFHVHALKNVIYLYNKPTNAHNVIWYFTIIRSNIKNQVVLSFFFTFICTCIDTLMVVTVVTKTCRWRIIICDWTYLKMCSCWFIIYVW